jgi:hypothetical protein
MKISKPLIVISSLSFLGAIAAASGACSASATIGLPPNVTLPGSAQAFTGTIPTGLDATCSPGDSFVWESGGPCPGGGVTYLLCDGTSWSDFDCTNPASDGWTPVGGSPDAGPTGDATPTGDAAPTGDAQAPVDGSPSTEAGHGDDAAVDAAVTDGGGPATDGGTSAGDAADKG